MQIDNKKVDLFYDLIDKACMIYYNDIKRDYLEAFISFTNALINGLDEPKLSNKAVQKLEKIINQISSKMKYLSNFQKKKSNQNYHPNMNDLIDFQKKKQINFHSNNIFKMCHKTHEIDVFFYEKCYSKLFEMYLIIRQYVKS